MKVYVLMGEDYMGTFICGIFANQKTAEEEKKMREAIVKQAMESNCVVYTWFEIQEYNIIE